MWLVYHLPSAILILLFTPLCSCAAMETDMYGPYDHVYPNVDITESQHACSVDVNGSCPLYIALMMSFGGDFDSRAVIPGVQLAIDQINRDPTMLPGYTLHYILKATTCLTHGVKALDSLHTHLLQPPTKIGVIGSGCSLATEPTAQISHYYNITHLSCASSSTELSNRERFRYHFQLLATEADLAIGFYSIIRHFGWRRVGIFLQEDALFEVTMDRLIEMLESSGARIEISTFRFSSSKGIAELGENPFDPDYRILIFAMFSNHARRLLCKAYEQGLRYPRYEFLFYGWYSEEWWKVEGDTLGCTAEERQSVIGPALSPLQDEFISNCSRTTDSGINGEEFQRKYESLLNTSRGPPLSISSQSLYAQQCYDATWTLARALNSTINDIADDLGLNQKLKQYEENLEPNVDFAIQHFTYNNSGVLDLIFGHLNRTSFNGITGEVSFQSSNGVRYIPRTIVYQYRPMNTPECFICTCQNATSARQTFGREIIAYVDHSNMSLDFVIDEDSLWTDGVPYDGVPEQKVETVHVGVTIVFSLLSTAGIIYALSCMVFNFMYRDKKLIRLSSPNLNYLIIIGAIILYVDVYLFVIPIDNERAAIAVCNLTPWLTAIGYSLCYGTIIVKMFRIFYIIHNLFSPNRFLKDWVLALAVGVLVLIDVIILSIYFIVEGTSGSFTPDIKPNDEHFIALLGPAQIEIQHKFFVCDSKSRDIALGILYGYKAVLQVIALIFSFSLGKIKIKGLNDAKFIAVAVYVTSVVTAVIFVSLYSLKTYLNLYATLFSFGFFVGTTVILVLVFMPKMVSLYRDPNCKKVVVKISHEEVPGTSMDNLTENTIQSQTIEKMQKKIKELESRVQSQQRKLDLYAERDGSLHISSENDKSAMSRESNQNNIDKAQPSI